MGSSNMCTWSCLREKGSTVTARPPFLGSIRAVGSSHVHVSPFPMGKLRIFHFEGSTFPFDISSYKFSVASMILNTMLQKLCKYNCSEEKVGKKGERQIRHRRLSTCPSNDWMQ